MEETKSPLPDLVEVRRDGTVMRMDVAALVTLIQQRAVFAETEVRSEHLTGNEWQRLGQLELYRTFTSQKSEIRNQNDPATMAEVSLPPLERAEQNLARYFNSLAVTQLRRDALGSIIAAGVTAALSVLVHHYALILVLSALGWGAGYLLTVQVLFRGWIGQVRTRGFTRLPWNSRVLLIAGIALPGYFLIASMLPLLPGETLLRWIDGAISLWFAAASAAIWAFRIETGRMKRVFELSTGVKLKQVEGNDER
jgi:ABC-type multidrug transport system fused ATPase/permease subunit